jgi:3-hydroxyacyl-[acyl-carrier-protein] dehydratase
MSPDEDGRAIESLLPHRDPFLFVTRVERREAEMLVASWRVDGSEEFLRGHFPGEPIVPGVLLVEALAQAAGLWLAGDRGPCATNAPRGFLARVDVRFHAPVRPPATIGLSAIRTGGLGSLHQFDVVASCGGTRLASGSVVLSVAD